MTEQPFLTEGPLFIILASTASIAFAFGLILLGWSLWALWEHYHD